MKIPGYLVANLTAEELLLYLYAALLPLMNTAFFTIGGKKILSADLIFLPLFAVFLSGVFSGRRKLRLTGIEMPVLIMLASFLPSFINSVNIGVSLLELCTFVYLCLLLFTTYNIIDTPEKLKRFITVWILAAIAASLTGLAAFIAAAFDKNLITNNPFLYYETIESMAHHFPRIHSTFANANMFLTYLHTSFVFLVILWFMRQGRMRHFGFALSFVTLLITAFLTGSRRLAGFLLTMILILRRFGHSRCANFWRDLVIISFILVLLASIITTIWVIFPVEVKKDAYGKITGIYPDYRYSLHLLQPVTSLKMFTRHPLIGVGLGTYILNFRENVDWPWLRRSFGFEAYPSCIKPVEDKTFFLDPHSVFLGTLAETGLIGFIGIIYFFSSLGICFFRKLRDKGEQELISRCILSGFLGFMLNGITIDILSMRHFWIMLAVGLSPLYLKNKQQ
jgi:O-antigen ligase